MRLYKTHFFEKIRKIWENLYNQTPNVSPFLKTKSFEIAYRYFYPYYLKNRHLPVFCVFMESDDEPLAIIPLLKGIDGIYRLLGAFNGFNECGFVYKPTTDISQMLMILKGEFGKVEFQKIDERSPICNHLPIDFKQTNNVAINFENGFDNWFKSLSASVRQNIRTAYNRLQKDDKHLNVIASGGGKNLPVRDLISLYCSRHEQRYGIKTSAVKKWFLKNQSFATRLYCKAPNSITIILEINGKLAAFLSGLYDTERLIVPRLSINDEFRRYSPGMILVNETIKYFDSSSQLRVLDLSMGEEPYKFQLGGIIHKSYTFRL